MDYYIYLAKGQFKQNENPTEDQINAKAQELKNADEARENARASGKQKLLDLGLTEEEVKALVGV